jgi:hypothetical protein
MSRYILLTLVSLALSSPVFAQSPPAPAVEVFGGYSLLPANVLTDFPRHTSHGVQGGVAVNVSRWFGIAGDAGIQRNTTDDLGPNFAGLTAKTTVREFLIGPRFTMRSGSVDLFAGGWFGTSIGSANDEFKGFADSGMTFGGGVGLDVHAGRRVAMRVQYDLIGSFADMVEENSRLGAGLVLRLGQR